MLASLSADGPVVFLEHKQFSETWDDALATGGRRTHSLGSRLVRLRANAPRRWLPVPLGEAAVRRKGTDLTLVTLAAGVHWAMEAAEVLARSGIQASVIDLRCLSPLDRDTLCGSVRETGRLLVIDEDYQGFGLSGELAAIVMEQGVRARYARVCTGGTIPYSRSLELEAIPNTRRIVAAAHDLMA
jgi:pyruvate dehydrogenase E1 component beta subunit